MGLHVYLEYGSANIHTGGNAHWIVPRPLNRLFTGRSELVGRIESALRMNGEGAAERKQLVITGIGGIGKSEVCLKVADLMREECVAALYCYMPVPC